MVATIVSRSTRECKSLAEVVSLLKTNADVSVSIDDSTSFDLHVREGSGNVSGVATFNGAEYPLPFAKGINRGRFDVSTLQAALKTLGINIA